LVDNLDYELDSDSAKLLTALSVKLYLTPFSVVVNHSNSNSNNNNRSHIASNWLLHLKYDNRIYLLPVFGDVIIRDAGLMLARLC